jgi:hypothetical protein
VFFVVAAAAASGGVSIFVVVAANTAIPNNVIAVDNSEPAIPAAMYAFAIVAVAAAADDEAYLLGLGVIRDVPRAVDAASRESRSGAIPRSAAYQYLVVPFKRCVGMVDAGSIGVGGGRRGRRNGDAALHTHEGGGHGYDVIQQAKIRRGGG